MGTATQEKPKRPRIPAPLFRRLREHAAELSVKSGKWISAEQVLIRLIEAEIAKNGRKP